MRRGGGLITFFFILTAITLLLDWYVFSGLKTLSADWKPRRRAVLSWGYLAVSLAVTGTFIFGILFTDMSHGLNVFHSWSLSIFLTFFITKIFFILVLSLGDLGRFVAGIAQNAGKSSDLKTQSYFPERRKFLAELAVLIAAVPFASFFYAMFRGKYDYKVHRSDVFFKNLPEAFDGFTITQLSDIHSGSFDNVSAMQKGIDIAKAQKSDLYVFTGDLVNNHADEIEPYLSRFGQIKAPFGQFSILGNHDYGDYIEWESEQAKAKNLETLKQHHKEMGYRLLLDEAVKLEKAGQSITLLGVQNWGHDFKQLGDIDKALKGVEPNAFKILLSHDPTHWEEKIQNHPTTIDLTLSGHTHGAQFGVETAGFRWSPVQYRYLQWAGFAKNKNRTLYVNRGFGFLAFTGRLGIWPEITVLTLRKG